MILHALAVHWRRALTIEGELVAEYRGFLDRSLRGFNASRRMSSVLSSRAAAEPGRCGNVWHPRGVGERLSKAACDGKYRRRFRPLPSRRYAARFIRQDRSRATRSGHQGRSRSWMGSGAGWNWLEAKPLRQPPRHQVLTDNEPRVGIGPATARQPPAFPGESRKQGRISSWPGKPK